jgi:amino acid transporter
MSETPASVAPRPRQVLNARIFWFLVGSIVNYLMISTPFNYLKAHTQLSVFTISACSIGFSTVFFFLWNYFINFRTDSRKRDALARYVAAVACMWALSFNLLAFLKQHDFHRSFSLLGRSLDLDIIATQFLLGGLKFVLYNFWVFPRPRQEQQPES